MILAAVASYYGGSLSTPVDLMDVDELRWWHNSAAALEEERASAST